MATITLDKKNHQHRNYKVITENIFSADTQAIKNHSTSRGIKTKQNYMLSTGT